MATFPVKIGSTKPLVFRPQDSDGSYPPLAGVAMQMRIRDGNACLIVDGVLNEDQFEVDLNALTLIPRLYHASLYFDWGDGWEHTAHISLIVEGGC